MGVKIVSVGESNGVDSPLEFEVLDAEVAADEKEDISSMQP